MRCCRRAPYRRPRGVLMTDEAREYGTPCATEFRDVPDGQGNVHQALFLSGPPDCVAQWAEDEADAAQA